MVMVAFLGPDGSGKSSVIDALIDDLPPPYETYHWFHQRPRLGQKPLSRHHSPVNEPHGLPNRNPLVSILKLLYFWGDYHLGYWLKIRTLNQNNTLIIFDRYYHDVLVDPRRYRYGGPVWLARLIGRLIPMPDHVILLHANPVILQSRKQEVGPEETTRQCKAYLEIVRTLPSRSIVDASRPLGEVVRDVREILTNLPLKAFPCR